MPARNQKKHICGAKKVRAIPIQISPTHHSMKSSILLLCLLTLTGFAGSAQAQRFFIQLFGADGKMIRGNSIARGFERQIEARSFTSSLQSPELQFTMNTDPASAVLQRNVKSGEHIRGLVTVVEGNSDARARTIYTVTFDKATVISCIDAAGQGQTITTVKLQVERIGLTHYEQKKSGASTVSSKSGYDFTANREWDLF